MKQVATQWLGAVVLSLAATSAMAQSPYDDMACRQYADQAIVPLRQQADASSVGSALVGAGLGAALGAAVGGGRGAGIGAASGAIAGTGVGAANAQYSASSIQQWYGYYYSQCMQSRAPAAPGYAQPGYAPPGYYPYR